MFLGMGDAQSMIASRFVEDGTTISPEAAAHLQAQTGQATPDYLVTGSGWGVAMKSLQQQQPYDIKGAMAALMATGRPTFGEPVRASRSYLVPALIAGAVLVAVVVAVSR